MTRAVRAALAKLVAGLADAGRGPRARHPRADDRRQPDHAPPPARDRSDPARLRAVRAGHRSGRPDDRPPSSASAPTRARGSTSCRASPATSGPTRPAVILAETPHRAERADADRRRRHERRDRARRPRSAAGGLEPDRAGLRGRPDQRRPARRAGRDRAGPDRPRDARAAVQGHRLASCWSDEPGFAEATRGARRHRDLRLGDRRGRSPSCSWPA